MHFMENTNKMGFFLDMWSFFFILLYLFGECYGEICYRSSYSFYCCGTCTSGAIQFCEDDGAYYASYYDSCVLEDILSGGALVGIVIGSLVGVIIVAGLVIFFCCGCKITTARKGNVIAPSNRTAVVAVVSTSNTGEQSFQAGYIMQPTQPMNPNRSPGEPMPMYKSEAQQMSMYPPQNQQNPASQMPQQSSHPPQLNIINNPPPPAATYNTFPPPTYNETTKQ